MRPSPTALAAQRPAISPPRTACHTRTAYGVDLAGSGTCHHKGITHKTPLLVHRNHLHAGLATYIPGKMAHGCQREQKALEPFGGLILFLAGAAYPNAGKIFARNNPAKACGMLSLEEEAHLVCVPVLNPETGLQDWQPPEPPFLANHSPHHGIEAVRADDHIGVYGQYFPVRPLDHCCVPVQNFPEAVPPKQACSKLFRSFPQFL